jgi:uncharacterized surface protein with fasciclin (FAS1) repeats
MKIFNKIKGTCLLLLAAAVFFTSCNKLELNPTPNIQPKQDTTPTLGTLINDPSFSAFKAALKKAGLLNSLSVTTLRFSIFAPDDAAIAASLPPGVPLLAFIASLDTPSIRALVSYHIVPQTVTISGLSTTFPNFEYPTLFNPAPSISALLRLTTFPSVRSGIGAWVNNVPITAADMTAVNGVLHKVASIVAPPTKDLWTIINSESDLTYFKAAIARADSGAIPGKRLQDALNTAVNPSAIGSNLTVFAPTDTAMQSFIVRAITGALIGQGLPPASAQAQATFLVTTYGTQLLTNPSAISPLLGATITPTLAAGLVAYHILSSQSGTFAPPGIRVFSVNIPTTATAVKTLLNSAVSVHPGVVLQATFLNGLPVIDKATVMGAANSTASKILSFDLHCVNGVLHKIDQALKPQ